jgi:peptide alpha-N-acetyltransferase
MADDILYVDYADESVLAEIMQLVANDLSEPYSIFTYRYFLHNWPSLCVCAYTKSSSGGAGEMIGTIICKADTEGDSFLKGYIAMLAVSTSQRKKGIGLTLARMGIDRMIAMGCEEIALEAEATNVGALGLYEKLGFVRDDKLARYYLNGGDAFRLRLLIDRPQQEQEEEADITSISINAASS